VSGTRKPPPVSFPCYDKYHRCPGWNGPRLRYHREGREWCRNGRVAVDYDDPRWRWRFWRCNACGVLVLPYNVRRVDPGWWLSELRTWRRYR
jgi:hypothetical protein